MQRFPDHSAHPSAILRCVRMSLGVETGSTGHPSADGRGCVKTPLAGFECFDDAFLVYPRAVLRRFLLKNEKNRTYANRISGFYTPSAKSRPLVGHIAFPKANI